MTRTFFITGALAIALGLGLAACGDVRINVNATMPATRIDLAKQGVKRIAVGEITIPSKGRDGDGAAAVMGEDLRAGLVDLGRFEILDRTATNALLQEHKFNASGMVNEGTAAQTGKFSGATALVIGTLTVYTANSQLRSQVMNRSPAEGGGSTTYYQRTNTATIEVSFKLIDIETGRLIAVAASTAKASEVIPKNANAGTTDMFGLPRQGTADNTWSATPPVEPDLSELLAQVRKDAVRQFVRQIAPYAITDQVTLEGDGDVPSMERGQKAAQIGEWAEAETAFAEGTKVKPTSAPAFYNLGIAQRAQGKFDEALASFKAAFRNDSKPRYQAEIEKTKQFAAGSSQK